MDNAYIEGPVYGPPVAPVDNPFGKRRKGDDPLDDIFADFDREFRRMQEHMNDLFEHALKNADIPKGKAQPGNPFVYGFTMRLGPDGKPRIEQFGNTPRAGIQAGKPEVTLEGREPITDVIEHDDHVSVTCELPGVEKEDIQVFATEQELSIKVDTAQRKYHKVLQLPAKCKADTTDATFKNGVLDVTVQKERRSSPKEPGRRVNVK